jgi:hypothetical protein
MAIASRLYAGLAAFALVLAGIAVVVPSTAQAQRAVPGALVAGVIVTATVVTAIVLLDNGGGDNDDEGPQSP